MLKKISRKAFLETYPDFTRTDYRRDKFFSPETYDSYILYVEAKSTIGLCNNVSAAVAKLINALGYTDLAFLGDGTTPWLFREHDYKPVKRGLDYLIENKISKSFNGAIQVDNRELSVFVKHLFWLVRCNGVVFDAYFSDPGFNIIASICKYGNLHFSTLNEKTDLTFNEVLDQTNFHISTDNNCGGGRIPGRTAIL